MTAREVQLPPPLECLRCHHKWVPRQREVRTCPCCRSPYWDTPKKNKSSDNGKIYARPHGEHYHLKRDCPMLAGNEFKKMGYHEIASTDIRKRRLIPCICAHNPKRNNNRKEERT